MTHHHGDPCPHCGLARDAVPVGECKGRAPAPAEADLTQEDVLKAHAEFGPLDWHMVKAGMGPNWPVEWEALGPGEGIFAPEEDRTP